MTVQHASRRRRSLRVVGLILGLVAIVAARVTGAAEAPVGLGTAESFAVLAGAGVTNTGPSVISGNLGTCPTIAITGFPPGMVVNGTIHAADAEACQAQSDLTIAYNDAAGRAPTTTFAGPTDLGGMRLTPGVYTTPTSFAITGTLTLDAQGDPNAVFIFQAGSTLITAPNSRVVLVNGAQACNVFWQVGSSAVLGVGSTFIGTILALTSITAGTNAEVQGRLLARNGAVTLDSNTVTRPVCAPTTTTTLGPTTTTIGPTTTLAPTTTTTLAPTTTTTLAPTTSTTLAPITIPPITIPPITIPPITIPDITIPPITIPDITIPPITVPDITIPTIPTTTTTVVPTTTTTTTPQTTTTSSTTTTPQTTTTSATTTTSPTTTTVPTTTTSATTTLPTPTADTDTDGGDTADFGARTAERSGGSLARTGGGLDRLVLWGAIVMAVGVVAVAATRTRRRDRMATFEQWLDRADFTELAEFGRRVSQSPRRRRHRRPR